MTRRYRPFDPFERGPFEPPRELRAPRPPQRFWVGVGLFGAAILIFIFANPIVSLITELQWYDALGVTDPVLGQDISFYLLSLPFLHSVVNWALGLGFMGTLLIAVLYAWRGDSFDLNFSPLAIAHLSAMLAVFAVALAAWLWLGRFDFPYSHNNKLVWGAAYTHVNAPLPLITFQAGGGNLVAGGPIP